MSIRKRLLLSNIGMVIIPIIGIILVEAVAGFVFFYLFNRNPNGEDLQWFLSFRFGAIVFIIVVTNGLLTYYVSKSIIGPIKELMVAAKKISDGDLDHRVTVDQLDELGQLSAAFEDMRLKLKEAETLQQQYQKNRQELIASISHDLKTPLTSIKGYVNGVQDGLANTPDKLNRYMDKIEKNTNDLAGLIDELFLFSKLDMEQMPFHYENVHLDEYFTDYMDELSYTLAQTHGKAILDYDQTEFFLVSADRDKLNRVVMNIMQNCLKYMDKDKGEIRVSLRNQGDFVGVKIQDNGVGIPGDELPNIFDSFYRTDASRNSSTGGSGLGLSIAKKIIEGHGGRIWAESERGVGTSIYFTLKKVRHDAKNINY